MANDGNGDASKKGNQFVWIPVPDYDEFHLIFGYCNGSLQTNGFTATNPIREAGANGDPAPYLPGLPYTGNTVKGTEESIAMYKSVKDNGGFYIARFEAGVPGTSASTTTNDDNKRTQNGTVKPLSQKGVGVWNNIRWGGTGSDANGLPGNDRVDGAVKVARSMYPSEDTAYGVTSTLCYGVEWDAAIQFIISDQEKYADFEKDSSGKGNNGTSIIAVTGSNENYATKNIYDMAGNMYEWTMEAYGNDSLVGRIVRGGGYEDGGIIWPVSYRGWTDASCVNYTYSFRPALYLN